MKRLLHPIAGVVCVLAAQPAHLRGDASERESAPAVGAPGRADISAIHSSPGAAVGWKNNRWVIADGKLFDSELVRYLNSDAVEDADEGAFQKTRKLIAEKTKLPNRGLVDEAQIVKLLEGVADLETDSAFSRVLADQLQAVIQSRADLRKLVDTEGKLKAESGRLTWNANMVMKANPVDDIMAKEEDQLSPKEWGRLNKRDLELTPLTSRLAQIETEIKSNRARQLLVERNAMKEFQLVVAQLFLQRRFEHVLTGVQLYRWLFPNGELRFWDAKAEMLFARTDGSTPSLSGLETFARQAIEESKSNADLFGSLWSRKELYRASLCLADATTMGGHMPGLRNIPREARRQVLDFLQQRSRLESLVSVRDYGAAAVLLREIQKMAPDFDGVSELSVIARARILSDWRMAKARQAMKLGDFGVGQSELLGAMQIWPKNPGVVRMMSEISDSGFSSDAGTLP